jgi:hypothetical protein
VNHVSGFVASVRGFWRALRKGPGTQVKHHGHDLARTAKDTHTVNRSIVGGGSGTSSVDEHVGSGANDYAKSFDKGK